MGGQCHGRVTARRGCTGLLSPQSVVGLAATVVAAAEREELLDAAHLTAVSAGRILPTEEGLIEIGAFGQVAIHLRGSWWSVHRLGVIRGTNFAVGRGRKLATRRIAAVRRDH